jgi:hypothetical protein
MRLKMTGGRFWMVLDLVGQIGGRGGAEVGVWMEWGEGGVVDS